MRSRKDEYQVRHDSENFINNLMIAAWWTRKQTSWKKCVELQRWECLFDAVIGRRMAKCHGTVHTWFRNSWKRHPEELISAFLHHYIKPVKSKVYGKSTETEICTGKKPLDLVTSCIIGYKWHKSKQSLISKSGHTSMDYFYWIKGKRGISMINSWK